ncbi:DUF3105 domain-containing protein [Microtetraspora fusca]|uniref:DUF3105 domain-containing protein n=1 Tax=Microtetraspora fusca TaxID=1997 RepID=A0ABW6UWX3_MICFU
MSGDRREVVRGRLSELRSRQRKAEGLRRVAVSAAVVALVSGALAAVAVIVFTERGRTSLDAVKSFTVTDRTHTTEPVRYPQTPPVGGNHDPAWQNCGVYNQPIRDENAVHAQEHGAVWISYRPDVPRAEVEKVLTAMAGRDYILLSPHPKQAAPFVASAWSKQLMLESADDPRLSAFLRAHIKGPETPEPGAPCDGGVGEPLL